MRSGKIRLAFVILLVALAAVSAYFLGGCAAPRAVVTAEVQKPPEDSTEVTQIVSTPTSWVERRLNAMTLEEKAAQLIMVRAFGYFFNDETDLFQRLNRAIREKKYGGVVLFQGDVMSAAVLLNRLQEMSDVPLLVAADFEWGSAMRLRRATRFPEAMALGASRDSVLAYRMGRAVAREARAIGIQQVYAPVADVNLNPDNPVINIRSFGESPKLVADMATAVARGLQSEGAIATAKHFPGHGDTDVDSHLGLPLIIYSRQRLDTVEIAPFRRLVERGITSIMTAHIVLPALDAGKKPIPATLSKKIVGGLLQGELGFDGLVVTDAMEMRGLMVGYSVDSAAVLALDAGVDVLLLPADEDATLDAVVRAVRRGRLTEQRIDRSVRKILALKQWAGLDEKRTVDVERIPSIVGQPEHLRLATEIARSSITILSNRSSVLPLRRASRRAALTIIVSDIEDYRTEVHRFDTPAANERVGEYLMTQLRRRRAMPSVRIDPSTNAAAIDSIVKRASNAEVILIPIFSKARSAYGRFGLPQNVIDAVNRVLRLNRPTALVAIGSPYTLRSFPNAGAYLCSYSDAEVSMDATAEVLFGEIPTNGRLPVTIPGMFEFGTGIVTPQLALRRDLPEYVGFEPDRLATIDSIMLRAIADSAFPGAQLLVAKDGAIVVNNAYGVLEYASNPPPVNLETMYDIASLTKVVATTSCVMRLYDEGKLALDDPVIKYIPQFGANGKSKITIRNLLLHNSGLPAFKQLFLTVRLPQELLDSVYASALVYRTGDSTIYSDFGFITLGKIVEAITGMPLDQYAKAAFFDPLGMTRTMYNPPESLWVNAAPTEHDTIWRKSLARGVVHDENAAALGGVSGHAGLFSSAPDLAVLAQMLLNNGSYAGVQYLKPQTVKLFTTKATPSSNRMLGWDAKTVGGYSSAGSLFSGSSFGHLGFTGTSIWIDPERKIFVILLTNRVHPTRANTKIIQIRPAVHDAVVKALRAAPQAGR
jgi:beta-N-acetylhexosaminidase